MLFNKRKKIPKTALADTPKDTKRAVLLFWKLLMEEKVKVVTVFFSNVISTILYMLVPWIAAILIDKVIAVISDGSISNKWAAIQMEIISGIIALAVIGLLVFIMNYFQEYVIASVSENLSLSLRKKLTEKMTKLPMNFYDTTQVGELLSKATTDIDKISDMIVTGFNQMVYSVVCILLGIGILFTIRVDMTFVILAVLILGGVGTAIISKINNELFEKHMATLSALSSTTEETLAGNLVVKVYGQEERFIQTIDQDIEAQYQANKFSQFVVYSIYPAIRFINQIAFILAALIGANLAIQGILTVGLVQAFLQYVTQISEPITNSSYMINSFQGALVATERIYQILDLPEEVQVSDDELITLDQPKGAIQFDHVSFSYTKEKPLMKDVNVAIKEKQMVAIVGPTGAGKTTLVNLLMRFYDVNAGQITFDGQPITKLSRKALRRNFGMVLQDTWLFHGTVAENIAYGNPKATQNEIEAAAKLARCHSVIKKLPEGYQTIISSEGSTLSQGEQQLITIARAILTDPRVMILDEATSSIDTKTEKDIQTAMNQVMQGRTSFVIAHRLSTIKNADLILVMDKGNIIEHGTHSQLLGQPSLYARLYNSQFQA
ncbi:ABC transporter ATP-binding protein [Enterococcus sp. HY326]|uniref:ABC transporter ATP-binding protein n=1 Tax=Enterococcus sp. HY326 TaxID=2971265 RepID=UPI0022409C8A|nr:ABC transporter ATP-binding protein [Enterococcus sp. HY326]